MGSQKLAPRRRAHKLAAAATFALIAVPALAAENDWTSLSNGNWSTGANWSLGVPVAGQDAVIGHGPPNEGNPDLTVTFDANLVGALNSLTLDSQNVTGQLIFNQTTDGTTLMATTESLGTTTGNNTYNQSAGTNNAHQLTIGLKSIDNTYNLSGNAVLTSDGGEVLGSFQGACIFNQTGGINELLSNVVDEG